MLTIISSIRDLENWVQEHVSDINPVEVLVIKEVVRNHPRRPALGCDWSTFFGELPDNLCELLPPPELHAGCKGCGAGPDEGCECPRASDVEFWSQYEVQS